MTPAEFEHSRTISNFPGYHSAVMAISAMTAVVCAQLGLSIALAPAKT